MDDPIHTYDFIKGIINVRKDDIIGVFNLLPIPMLDGGNAVIYTYESIYTYT